MSGLSKQRPRSRYSWPTPEIRKRIRQEAKALGVSNEEYIRLLLSFSSLVRNCLPNEQTFEASEILRLIENPLFASAFAMLAQSAVSQLSSSTTEDATSTKPTETPQTTVPRPGYMTPPHMWSNPIRPPARSMDGSPVPSRPSPYPMNVPPWSFY